MPRIVISQGWGKGNCYEITGDTSIGRSTSNMLLLIDNSVSRKHAIIQKQGNDFIIKDLESRNGILINNKKVVQHTLQPGDLITIGKIKLIYEPDFEIKTDSGQKGGLFILSEKSTAPSFITTPFTDLDKTSQTLLIKPTEIKESNSQMVEVLNRRLDTLYEISEAINATTLEEELLNKVMEVLIRVFGVERGAIILCDESGENPSPAVIKAKRKTPKDIVISQTILNEVVKNRQAILSSNIGVDQRFLSSHSVKLEQIKSMLCVPLISKNKLFGLIYLDTREYWQTFEEEDIKLLTAVSHQLATTIENVRLHSQIREEIEVLRKKVQEEISFIGEDKKINGLLEKVRKIAPTDITVLITGETGTGKELIAHAIHYQSLRRNKPFITVDCSAIPQSLMESELFGHEKGAFTGADRAKPGRFELANEGTLFLDEIGNLDLATQAKLLRLVEEKEFCRVGSVKIISADVRIIAATNLNLEESVKQSTFREDLFYRLTVVPIVIPPLRERKTDISLLIKYFLRKFISESGKNITGINPQALEILENYLWPGNVRELRNVIERAVVLCEKTMITPEDLPLNITQGISRDKLVARDGKRDETQLSLDKATQEVEKEYILRVLKATKGKKSQAAELLKISRPTLNKKLKQYGIYPPR